LRLFFIAASVSIICGGFVIASAAASVVVGLSVFVFGVAAAGVNVDSTAAAGVGVDSAA